MVPSVIAEITWHAPGGRYHSPSIITADPPRCHAHQRLDQCGARKWPVDILLRRESGIWTRRERQPCFPDVYRATDLPECLPPGGCCAGLWGVEEQRHSQCRRLPCRQRGSVLCTAYRSRGLSADARGHGPGTAATGSGSEPKRGRRSTGPQVRHTPQGDPAGPADQARSTSAPRSRYVGIRRLSGRQPPPTSPHAPPWTPWRKWAQPAPGPTNASWQHSVS
jgi:hypothetical protein